MDKRLRVVYVEDDLSDVAILKKILDASQHFKFLAHFPTGKDALRLCPQIHPDFIIVDCNVDMPLVDLVTELIERCPESAIITTSVADSADYMQAMMLAGVRFFMTKPLAEPQVHNTLTSIANQLWAKFKD